MATKLETTVAVKIIESQRWIWRIHVFQFNKTSSKDKPKWIGDPLGGGFFATLVDLMSALTGQAMVLNARS